MQMTRLPFGAVLSKLDLVPAVSELPWRLISELGPKTAQYFALVFFFLTEHKLYVWNPLSCWTSSFFTVPLRIIFPFPVTTLDCTLGGSFKSVMSLMFFFYHARNIPRVTLMLSQAVQMCIHGRLLLSCCNTLPLCLLACQMWISSS